MFTIYVNYISFVVQKRMVNQVEVLISNQHLPAAYGRY